jgi:hypothetical protein
VTDNKAYQGHSTRGKFQDEILGFGAWSVPKPTRPHAPKLKKAFLVPFAAGQKELVR